MNDPDQKLALYEYSTCPFCRRVRNFLASLGKTVESRDISQNREYFEELVAATGRGTVPCLRIENADGSVRWLPESADIIAYLNDHFGAPS